MVNLDEFIKNKIKELDEGNELEDFRKDKGVKKFFNKLRKDTSNKDTNIEENKK